MGIAAPTSDIHLAAAVRGPRSGAAVGRRREGLCVTGHMNLEEIERYTRAARKKKLADTPIAKLK